MAIRASGVTLPGAVDALAAGADLPVPIPGPGSELLVVVGPVGPERASLLLALGDLTRLCGGPGKAGDPRLPDERGVEGEARRCVATARVYGSGAPESCARVGELIGFAGIHAGRRTGGDAIGRALRAAGLSVVNDPGPAEPGVLPGLALYQELDPADQLLLAVALALAGEPGAVLVDAVDGPLDDAGCHRVWSVLRRIADSGTTVVAACGSAEGAGPYAHRTVLLPRPGEAGG